MLVIQISLIIQTVYTLNVYLKTRAHNNFIGIDSDGKPIVSNKTGAYKFNIQRMPTHHHHSERPFTIPGTYNGFYKNIHNVKHHNHTHELGCIHVLPDNIMRINDSGCGRTVMSGFDDLEIAHDHTHWGDHDSSSSCFEHTSSSVDSHDTNPVIIPQPVVMEDTHHIHHHRNLYKL
ncbi:hypothetical protein TCON_0121 [Astathelohania contejeani]|uniref:Uncharacterized protein n=1 Tax=Astathelohania contejeani TaxID=164912 RepID=A0ABQ7I2H6_9MICR|nr:hypothetical protein TCON_0121 [Thelohania contejeani]